MFDGLRNHDNPGLLSRRLLSLSIDAPLKRRRAKWPRVLQVLGALAEIGAYALAIAVIVALVAP